MEQNTQDYRDKMVFPMKSLKYALMDLGYDSGIENEDHELVDVAAKKLNMLYEMLLATGISKNLLKAAMNG